MNVDTGMVNTPVGEIAERDLRIELGWARLEDGRVVPIRDCFYIGRAADLTQHRGSVVRRDVWHETGEREYEPVGTTQGPLAQSDLDIKLLPQVGGPNVWVVARECRYKGNDPALSSCRGEIVRRDVWATIKSGHAMTGEQAKLG